jgi:hypothetical protein
MAQVSGPQNVGIPGYKLPPKPKPLANPWNTNIPGSGLASNNGSGGAIPLHAPPALAAPAAAPAAPPPPPDFNALTLSDPQYTTGINDLTRQNDLTLAQLLKGYRGSAQGAQDNANAHGALFSGAAVNAQNHLAQGYADQQAQQAQNLLGGEHNLYSNVYQRLLQQLAGGA